MEKRPEPGKGDYSLLASTDNADGFTITADECHNISLLRLSRPVAWFSAMLSGETIGAFVELLKFSASGKEERNGR